jgi:hypothetical protein
MTIRERPLADPREAIVVQLQLLDLMVRRERDPVSMDAVTRAALIDLMARVFMAVFHGASALSGIDPLLLTGIDPLT